MYMCIYVYVNNRHIPSCKKQTSINSPLFGDFQCQPQVWGRFFTESFSVGKTGTNTKRYGAQLAFSTTGRIASMLTTTRHLGCWKGAEILVEALGNLEKPKILLQNNSGELSICLALPPPKQEGLGCDSQITCRRILLDFSFGLKKAAGSWSKAAGSWSKSCSNVHRMLAESFRLAMALSLVLTGQRRTWRPLFFLSHFPGRLMPEKGGFFFILRKRHGMY